MINIALTDTMGTWHKLQLYIDWLKSGSFPLNIIVLSYKENNLTELAKCSGVVMTGGGDVDPAIYGGDPGHPKLKSVDRKRDDFERTVIGDALDKTMPFLGICRGLQITNVHLGGDLIPDLAEKGFGNHEAGKENETRHAITVAKPGVLRNISEREAGDVNSYHHQAAGRPGRNLEVTGRSDDGIIEAMEFTKGIYPAFFLLVQWHPERMKDIANPFCKNILDAFLEAVRVKEPAAYPATKPVLKK
ncbi:MAG: gamma-glutamyl-gamma-aminobutyrate hydrolase family protein [Bacteroidota bacterium]